ncbi:MAG: hypothetical protein SGILL_006702, partial [Bacillariaceae sp.]
MVLTASMYEDQDSFASSGGNVVNVSSNGRGGVELGEELNHDDNAAAVVVQPPPYPPPPVANSNNSFPPPPPPPVRIVETSMADWRMMVVDVDNNNARQGGTIIEEDDYELVQGGTLILDGDESNTHHNIPDSDASLTIPDSDALPSDPGTIDGSNSGRNESGSNNTSRDGNWEHLDSDDDDEDGTAGAGDSQHNRRLRFQRNLRKGKRWYNQHVRPFAAKLFPRKEGEAEDVSDSLTFSAFTAATAPKFMKSTGFTLLMVALFLLLLPAYSYFHLARSARLAEERWQQLQMENGRLQQQEELLKQELETLQEEAALAMAKATSLHREHEKWKLLHGTTDNKDFYFAGEGNEDCDKDSFSILDNCWVKAKARVDLGDCGDASKDFFKNMWDNLWSSELWGGGDAFAEYSDWDYYAFASGKDHEDDSAMTPF